METLLRTLARLLRLPVEAPPPPTALGVRDGHLAPCPRRPNCVSSRGATRYHAMAPLPDLGGGEATLARVREVLRAEPRARIVEEAPGYLRAEFTSRIFRYVDDVEFLWDAGERALHFRSASRVGRSDYGVNRARMERLRARVLEE